MTVTVRSPAGQSYTYNNGQYVMRSEHGYTDLYDRKGGSLIAQVPSDWLLEWTPPCVVRAAPVGADGALDLLLNNDGAELRRVHGHKLAELKQRLRKFYQRRRTWL